MIAVKDIAWLAGLLEGEGNFSLRVGKHLQIQLAMTDEDIMRRAAALLGAPIYGPYIPSQRKLDGTTKKPYWYIRVAQNRGAAWMMTLFSFMGIRRQGEICAALEVWGKQPNYVTRKYALCHPDRGHQAKGLCVRCYQQKYRDAKREEVHAHLTP